MSQAIPLTNSSQIASRANQEVSGGVLLLEASDNGTVEVKLQLDETPTSEYVEVIGRVSRTGDSITQHALLPLGDNLDLSLVEQLVKLTPKFPSLFSEQ
ncbi:hypothetical protein CBS9595_000642 [Malassezia furfur]|nr:hypothetical protein CBS9595_000642 [Malassezia furfur]